MDRDRPRRIIAVLDSMWGGDGATQAPRYFHINPRNFSGKRLYRIVGDSGRLLVTNSCRELGSTANCHGKPDPEWLRENLDRLSPFALVLVCGRVAQVTYARAGCDYPSVIEMPHPAARTWTNQAIEEMAAKVAAAVAPASKPRGAHAAGIG